jgi:hypothetical protein
MVRILSAAAAGFVLAAVVACAGQPARAAGEAPWCAVYDMGEAGAYWECEYPSIEACRPHILGGNRGWCNPNPAYRGAEKRPAPRHHRTRRHQG